MQLIYIMEELDNTIDDLECCSIGDMDDGIEEYVRRLRDVSLELLDFYKEHKEALKKLRDPADDLN